MVLGWQLVPNYAIHPSAAALLPFSGTVMVKLPITVLGGSWVV